MAYFETINLVQGDTKPELNFTLRDSATAVTGKTLDENEDAKVILVIVSYLRQLIHLKMKCCWRNF